jgi:hypothetical protein
MSISRRTTEGAGRRRALAGVSTLLMAGSLAVAAPAAAEAVTVAPSTTSGDGTTGCATGRLPSVVIGRPASFHAGLARGYWIWHDTTGWHLRATHASTARTVFTGVITATNPMTTVKVRDEAHDRVVRSADRRTTTFRFTNYGGVDGLDLTAGCSATVTFRLYADGALVAPSRIHLGARATAATANPLRVTRIPTT